jgi:hypothetical protein
VIIARQTGHKSNRTLSTYVRPQAASLRLVASPTKPTGAKVGQG